MESRLCVSLTTFFKAAGMPSYAFLTRGTAFWPAGTSMLLAAKHTAHPFLSLDVYPEAPWLQHVQEVHMDRTIEVRHEQTGEILLRMGLDKAMSFAHRDWDVSCMPFDAELLQEKLARKGLQLLPLQLSDAPSAVDTGVQIEGHLGMGGDTEEAEEGSIYREDGSGEESQEADGNEDLQRPHLVKGHISCSSQAFSKSAFETGLSDKLAQQQVERQQRQGQQQQQQQQAQQEGMLRLEDTLALLRVSEPLEGGMSGAPVLHMSSSAYNSRAGGGHSGSRAGASGSSSSSSSSSRKAPVAAGLALSRWSKDLAQQFSLLARADASIAAQAARAKQQGQLGAGGSLTAACIEGWALQDFLTDIRLWSRGRDGRTSSTTSTGRQSSGSGSGSTLSSKGMEARLFQVGSQGGQKEAHEKAALERALSNSGKGAGGKRGRAAAEVEGASMQHPPSLLVFEQMA